MKQLKRADTRAQQGEYAADVTARDSRPLKPPAGQQTHHRFPLAGGAVAAPVKPTTAMNAAAHPTGGSGRQAKAAAQTVDEKAGEALAARGHHPDGEHPAQKPRSADGSGQPTEQSCGCGSRSAVTA